jgi:Rod binding domain-containing protein
MNNDAIMSTLAPAQAPAPPAPSRGLIDDQRSFAAVLGRAGVGLLGAGTQRAAAAPAVKARDAAEQLVAIGLIQPVLKEFREGNRASPPFAPSPGERQFRALLDAELAQRISRAARFPLVERLAHDLLKRSAGHGPEPH